MENTVILIRCQNCRKLTTDRGACRKGSCKCGSKRFNGASPSGLIENLKVLYWTVKYIQWRTNG